MAIDVSKQVLSKTTLCENDFACLSKVPWKICRVRGELLKETLVIECAGECGCRYRMSFGNLCICSCPTRKEIYDRYTV